MTEQEKFGQFIKEIRQRNHLTQKELADKLGITYQAVSKWERGLNMPDKLTIKQIAKEFNVSIEEIFNGEYDRTTKKKPYLIPIVLLAVFLIIIIGVIIVTTKENDFKFKTITTSCDNFTLSGSLSYNKSKSAIYISNIEYCGQDNKLTYSEIECILYEKNNDIEKQISSYHKTNINLESFLKEVTFSVDNYTQTCKEYSQNSLYLLINATDKSNKITSYKIPLTLENNCSLEK